MEGSCYVGRTNRRMQEDLGNMYFIPVAQVNLPRARSSRRWDRKKEGRPLKEKRLSRKKEEGLGNCCSKMGTRGEEGFLRVPQEYGFV